MRGIKNKKKLDKRIDEYDKNLANIIKDKEAVSIEEWFDKKKRGESTRK